MSASGKLQTANCKRRMGAAFFLVMLVVLLAGCATPIRNSQFAIRNFATGIDPEAWAQIPAGTFHFGQHDEMVTIEQPYEMMVTDVTNAQYARYLNAALAKGRGQD